MKFLVIGDSCTDKFVYGKCEINSDDIECNTSYKDINVCCDQNGDVEQNVFGIQIVIYYFDNYYIF